MYIKKKTMKFFLETLCLRIIEKNIKNNQNLDKLYVSFLSYVISIELIFCKF